MEQLLHIHYMHTKVSDLITTPPPRPDNAQCTELISGAIALIKLFRGPHPFFKSPQHREQWAELAQQAQEKLAGLGAEQTAHGGGLIIAKRELVWAQVMGSDHWRRPLTELLRSDAAGMVSFVNERMIGAVRQVEAASALIFVGHRDWATLNRWERIQVTLAAKRYYEENDYWFVLQVINDKTAASPGSTRLTLSDGESCVEGIVKKSSLLARKDKDGASRRLRQFDLVYLEAWARDGIVLTFLDFLFRSPSFQKQPRELFGRPVHPLPSPQARWSTVGVFGGDESKGFVDFREFAPKESRGFSGRGVTTRLYLRLGSSFPPIDYPPLVIPALMELGPLATCYFVSLPESTAFSIAEWLAQATFNHAPASSFAGVFVEGCGKYIKGVLNHRCPADSAFEEALRRLTNLDQVIEDLDDLVKRFERYEASSQKIASGRGLSQKERKRAGAGGTLTRPALDWKKTDRFEAVCTLPEPTTLLAASNALKFCREQQWKCIGTLVKLLPAVLKAESTLEQLYHAHLDRVTLSRSAPTPASNRTLSLSLSLALPSASSASSDSTPASASASVPNPLKPLPLSTTTPKTRPKATPVSSTPRPLAAEAPAKPVRAPTTILPLRAASYFEDVASEGGEWTLLIAGRALKDWRALKDPVRTGAVEKMLIALSHGDFGGDNQKQLVGNHGEVPIYEAKVLGDLRLVYQVDVLPQGRDQVTQILRVWGIERHSTLDNRVWSAISNHSRKRGDEYRRRCNYRRKALQRGAKAQTTTLPQTFPFVDEPEVGPLAAEGFSETEMLKLHDLIALSKFVPFSKGVIRTILAQDDEAQHLFNMSPREREVVDHPSSSFIIGRSGTGKTTCILFKMIGLEQAAKLAPGLATRGKLRQVFLTQSPVLASKVKLYYQSIIATLASSKLTEEEAKAVAQQRALAAEREDLDDLEDESSALKGLPSRFSDLKDEHFPLFLSFDTLLTLLESEYSIDWGTRRTSEGQRAAFKRYKLEDSDATEQIGVDLDAKDDILDSLETSTTSSRLWERFVDAETFTDWFASFDQRLTKGVDPALCFSEILGIIRGSELAVETPKGYLSREDYLGLSERHSTYVSLRPAIYDIFLAYLKRKQNDLDRADRTHSLIQALAKHLSRWPPNSTTSTSTRLKIHFWPTAAVYRQEERQAQLADRKPVESKLFSLSLNYRSHAGITRVGSSLVDALLRLFPESIDRLPPEKGLVEGPKPIWLLSSEDAEAGDDLTSNFLFGEAGSGVEFGAEQVILVRNEAARENLRKKTGDVGLIMTIAEAKGLEFSEVLLWDYFADSTSSAADWRVILNLWKSGKGVPAFDAVRHASIGQELRHLYVAVTRARNVLCIADRDRTGDAMRNYFEHLELIKTIRPGESLPILAAASSSEAWLKQGRAMYSRRLYRQAAQCFRKAGAKLEESIANAYEERRKAKAAFRLAGRPTAAVVALFARVATLFRACARLAGESSSQRGKLYIVSADLFLSADRPADAASDFEQAGEFDRSALLFLRARKIEEAVRVVKAHITKVQDSTRAKVFYPARLSYLKRGKIESAKTLFATDEELLTFAEDYGFDDVHRDLLVALGRFEEAAQLAMDDGQLRVAATLYSKAGDHDSNVKAARCLSELLSQQLPFGSSDDWTDEKRFKQASEMLKETSAVLEAIEEPFDGEQELRKEITMYQLVTDKDLAALRTLGFAWKEENNLAHALNSLDAALSEFPELSYATLDNVDAYIGDVEAYSSLVQRLLKTGGKLDIADAPTQRLLGLRSAEGEEELELSEIKVLPTSPLFRLLPKPGQGEDKNEARLVSAATLRPLASCFLAKRLDDFLFLVSEVLEKAQALRPPCVAFALATCNATKCDRLHVASADLTEARFQKRLDVLSSIIQLFSSLDFATSVLGEEPDGPTRRTKQNKWLDILSHSLYPVHPFSGAAGEAQDRKREGAWLATTTIIARRSEDTLLRIKSQVGSAILPRWFRLATLAAETSPSSFGAIGARLPLVSAVSNDFVCGRGYEQGTVTEKLPLPFDAPLLVTLLEDLGSLAILSAATKSSAVEDWTWHELLLPRSIMRRFLRSSGARVAMHFPSGLVYELIRLISRAIASLVDCLPHLHVEGLPVQPGSIASIVLAERLFRLLGLLGQRNWYRVYAPVMNENKALGNYFGPRGFAQPLISGYLKAENYSQFEAEARRQSNRFSLDQLLLLDLSPAAKLTGPRGARIIRATTLGGIERQLFSTALSARAKPFIPSAILKANGSAKKEEESDGAGVEDVEVTEEEQAAINAARDAKEVERVKIETKHAIACQRAVRRRLKLEEEQRLLAAKPFTVFWLTFAAAGKQGRAFTLGPVVEIAFALDMQLKRLTKSRDALKKAWKSARDETLEAAGDLMTSGSKLRQALIAVLGNLKASDPLIISSSPAKLRTRLEQAPSLFRETEAQELAERMRIGVKGALTARKERVHTAESGEKPSLGGLDDDGDDEQLEERAEELGRLRA
ncbi:hypothetical protein BCR35DRAFT_332754 [Leucosporidium creatinivorum]|uniref:UvrD-like helicase C-terminal domain-containing protein n=1 Tax=Leucosporidium creatinivorum TaxID=106004 RepID=A0A1Y2EZB6_9BASI|nr:hypothetical protein BCR35DRAFT_332754 [Leucosporidium creatinivorum]